MKNKKQKHSPAGLNDDVDRVSNECGTLYAACVLPYAWEGKREMGFHCDRKSSACQNIWLGPPLFRSRRRCAVCSLAPSYLPEAPFRKGLSEKLFLPLAVPRYQSVLLYNVIILFEALLDSDIMCTIWPQETGINIKQ